MTARRLTKQVVDELVPRDTDYVVWCGKLPGFGCRVRATGHKSFIVMYRAGGRNATPRKVTIGVYGRLTVEQAREEAGKILAKAELGEDVALQRARVGDADRHHIRIGGGESKAAQSVLPRCYPKRIGL